MRYCHELSQFHLIEFIDFVEIFEYYNEFKLSCPDPRRFEYLPISLSWHEECPNLMLPQAVSGIIKLHSHTYISILSPIVVNCQI